MMQGFGAFNVRSLALMFTFAGGSSKVPCVSHIITSPF